MAAHPFLLGREPLTLEVLAEVARQGRQVELAPEARERLAASRAAVAAIAAGGEDAPKVYGVNTGFGFLAQVRISPAQVRDLQRNLVRSHAAGVGPDLPVEVVRAMVLLRAQTLALGHSGVRPEVAERLVEMLNRRLHPRIPSRGSVGASGDLAPLAHLALVLIGEGEVLGDNGPIPAEAALRAAGLAPLTLEAKEGLSLINGTQCMTALGALALLDAEEACRLADLAGAMSLEALQGTPRAFDERIQAVRPHPGQQVVAANLRRLLADSGIVESHRHCGRVQDAYSLRCMPQVHGASRDALAYARQVLSREAMSATDNPLLFPTAEPPGYEVLSGGNFHGQPVALALDLCAIAAAELGSISERRIEQLVNPHLSSGLPPFLVPDSGLHSGYMMAQVTAAALVSENKLLCHPASVDSIPSSAGREDHVSMGVHAAGKFARVVDNVLTVLAIELCCAAQGLDLRRPLRPGPALQEVHAVLRAEVPPLEADRPVHQDIAAVRRLCRSG
ncbi:MAG: histidine ammonia-lyase, partial [Myxococcales bacterium]|nr:histidine ammonia-lyase [Myxococcales bacterium]